MDRLKLWFLNNKIKAIVFFLMALCLGIGSIFIMNYSNKSMENEILDDIISLEEELESDVDTEEEKEIEYIYVDIKGYVNKPGVYRFDINSNSRVSDLISASGGLKKGANTSNINLAMRLVDEMTVIVYSQEEMDNYIKTKSDEQLKQEVCSNSVINDVCVNNDELNVSGKININKAGKDELMTLTGIGEAKALDIIEYRNSNGLFKSIDELMNVSGIGESVFQKIKDSITVE